MKEGGLKQCSPTAIVLRTLVGVAYVEIMSDGTIDWTAVSEALDYDMAYGAMGGEKSQLVQFYEDWQVRGDPIEAFFYIFRSGFGPNFPNLLLRIGLDYAEHVIEPLIWRFASSQHEPYKLFVIRCLSSVRGFLDGKEPSYVASMLDHEFDEYQGNEVHWRLFGAGRNNAIDVCARLIRAWLRLHFKEMGEFWNAMLYLCDETSEAAAWRGSDYQAYTDVGTAYSRSEDIWHIVHAARVIHALQFGEPWPALDELVAQ